MCKTHPAEPETPPSCFVPRDNLFTIPRYFRGNLSWTFLVFIFRAKARSSPLPGDVQSPHRAGQVKFVEAAATPEDCCRRADDDSLSTQAPTWHDAAVVLQRSATAGHLLPLLHRERTGESAARLRQLCFSRASLPHRILHPLTDLTLPPITFSHFLSLMVTAATFGVSFSGVFVTGTSPLGYEIVKAASRDTFCAKVCPVTGKRWGIPWSGYLSMPFDPARTINSKTVRGITDSGSAPSIAKESM